MGRSLHCNHAGFNPRTHTGCDSRHLADHCGCCRFNPRAHTGCDKKVAKTLLSYTCFNPRTHTGCDASTIEELQRKLFQSTHPHGVRRIIRPLIKCHVWFQSTHPHGVRLRTLRRSSRRGSFNPRTHTGCDSGTACISPLYCRFNPRTHTGCDDELDTDNATRQRVSIHAPTRGATF